MRIGLAAVGFKNGNIEYNKNKMIEVINNYRSKADLIVFGEAFLQGFDALCFDYEIDKVIAIKNDDLVINEIKDAAKINKIGISFGYFEKDGNYLYSSQMTINKNGEIIDVFRRVSPGWKEHYASSFYKEGNNFHLFRYNGLSISVGLCGDMWDNENTNKMKKLAPDIVLWPVYTDYNFKEWNNHIKYEYAAQSKLFADKVLLVNSVCLDKNEIDTSKGGAIYFEKGIIKSEIKAGEENILLVNF